MARLFYFISSPKALNENASLTTVGTISNPRIGQYYDDFQHARRGVVHRDHFRIRACFYQRGGPEPSTYFLLGVGAVSLAGFALRQMARHLI